MENFFVGIVILVILSAAAIYIYRAKKSGKTCIGCPNGGCSSGSCSGCVCGCGKQN